MSCLYIFTDQVFSETIFLAVQILSCNCILLCSFALAQESVAIDSRIKTFIYTKNQVFKIDANYGYQSFVEFAENEKVKTIAIGDGVSWNINPSGNKIFLRPFEKTGKTNMTVITNKTAFISKI